MNTAGRGTLEDADPLAGISVTDDLRGLARLLVQGVTATTDLAESVHASILGLPGVVLGREGPTTTRGIPRIAYQGVRTIANLVGGGVDGALATLAPRFPARGGSAQREALVAALNGVMGDHLAESGNPLALQAQLRIGGHALPLEGAPWPATVLPASPRVLVQVHGLCMNHLQWRHQGHDHGEVLAAAHGYTPVHLHYNSGQSIAANGLALSALLEQLLAGWPVPVERIAILGHSMGGLVARSAIASASRQQYGWVERLDRIVFLGTPHHGAPLERAGHALQTALGLTRWTAPFVRLGQLRSAGIQDLRHGRIDDAAVSGKREPVRLPAHVRAHVVAASMQAIAGKRDHHRARGDGLVPVRSALGLHRDPRLGLGIPANRQLVVERTGHLGLLSSREVADRLLDWLA
jgi:PGAP1-like protein